MKGCQFRIVLFALSALFVSACINSEFAENPTLSPDADEDGFTVAEGDCDDTTGGIHPGAPDVCDEIDNDCDGVADEPSSLMNEWCYDGDGDNAGESSTAIRACEAPPGYVLSCSDCNDTSATTCPLCPDLCADGIDNNCNGAVDESTPLFYLDLDGDGYGDPLHSVPACSAPSGYSPASGDCNDANSTINPGAPDTCFDSVDNNCDGYALNCGLSSSMTPLDADIRFEGESDGELAGSSIFVTGDINGDGYIDLIVNAPAANLDGMDDLENYGDGLSYLFYGPFFGDIYPEQADARIIGQDDCNVARASSGGDVNGDGLDDVVVAAPCSFAVGESCGPGAVLLYYGPLFGDLYPEDANVLFLGNIHTGFGWSAAIGYVNADAYGDILVGSPILDSLEYQEGAASLFYAPFDAQVRQDEAAATISGEHAGALAGADVTLDGDLNGDGLDDMIITAPSDSSAECGSGAVYVFYSPVEGMLSLADADARLFSSYRGDVAGVSVSALGDVNADGFDDLLIGALGWDPYCTVDSTKPPPTGRAYLVLGPVYGTWLLDDLALQLVGESKYDLAGESVSLDGDIDGDGYNDLVVGASSVDSGDLTVGTVYVQYGPLSSSQSLRDADVHIVGIKDSTSFGEWVTLGDINADGYSDVLVGAPRTGEKTDAVGEIDDHSGIVYVFLGGPRMTAESSDPALHPGVL